MINCIRFSFNCFWQLLHKKQFVLGAVVNNWFFPTSTPSLHHHPLAIALPLPLSLPSTACPRRLGGWDPCKAATPGAFESVARKVLPSWDLCSSGPHQAYAAHEGKGRKGIRLGRVGSTAIWEQSVIFEIWNNLIYISLILAIQRNRSCVIHIFDSVQ